MRKYIRGIVLVLLILLLPCMVWAEDEPENDIEITLNWGFNGKEEIAMPACRLRQH